MAMKEWKFRGFDAVGSKGWVYGDLVHNIKITKEKDVPRVMVGGYEVVPESVGLCTGIKDKDGKMIYGGDIVSVSYEGKHIFNATIVWVDRFAGFYMDEEDEKIYSPIAKDYVTVIGNVYDEQRA